MSPREGRNDDGKAPSPWSLTGLGFEIAVPIALGVYLGYRLDRWLDSSPWFLVIGSLLGMVVGFYGFFKSVWPKGNR